MPPTPKLSRSDGPTSPVVAAKDMKEKTVANLMERVSEIAVMPIVNLPGIVLPGEETVGVVEF